MQAWTAAYRGSANCHFTHTAGDSSEMGGWGASHFIVVIVIGVGVIYVLIWTAAILVCGAQHLRVDVWERTLSAFIKFIVLKGSVSQMKQAEQSSF